MRLGNSITKQLLKNKKDYRKGTYMRKDVTRRNSGKIRSSCNNSLTRKDFQKKRLMLLIQLYKLRSQRNVRVRT